MPETLAASACQKKREMIADGELYEALITRRIAPFAVLTTMLKESLFFYHACNLTPEVKE